METKQLQVALGLQIEVMPNEEHQFLMTTKDVAKGYDINEATLRGHKHNYKNELLEGVHFVTGQKSTSVGNTNARTLSTTYVFWTKAGVIRLGFFIKSERAKFFRNWVEKLVLDYMEYKPAALPAAPKRNHNRLSQDRLLDILYDINMITNDALRIRIANKLMGKE